MQYPTPLSLVARVERARREAALAPSLTWETRVLLAAAEAADAYVAPAQRALVACAIADKGAHPLRESPTITALVVALADALAAAGLASELSGWTVNRIAWRMALDLWGGPDR